MTTQSTSASLRSCVYGAAIGDALGVPFEFKSRGMFECDGMVGHGAHNMPAGTWSDDTSMMLATCDSIRVNQGRIDTADMLKRFRDWRANGAYTVDGYCFDIGGTTATALFEGKGCSDERSNGNGSLMRIAPLAFTDATDDQVRAVSAITHAHPVSTEACVTFIRILRDVVAEPGSLRASVSANAPELPEFSRLDGIWNLPADEIRSSGYVVHTLEASIWCVDRADGYAEAIITAVNLGHDTDTTACVAGALAGVIFGYDGIPADWIARLRGRDLLESCLF